MMAICNCVMFTTDCQLCYRFASTCTLATLHTSKISASFCTAGAISLLWQLVRGMLPMPAQVQTLLYAYKTLHTFLTWKISQGLCIDASQVRSPSSHNAVFSTTPTPRCESKGSCSRERSECQWSTSTDPAVWSCPTTCAVNPSWPCLGFMHRRAWSCQDAAHAEEMYAKNSQ